MQDLYGRNFYLGFMNEFNATKLKQASSSLVASATVTARHLSRGDVGAFAMIWTHMRSSWLFKLLIAMFFLPSSAQASVAMPPLSTTIPFIGALLSIALGPLLIPATWRKYDNAILTIWTILSTWLCFDGIGKDSTGHLLSGIVFKEYIPFIILIGALYIISSGIRIRINRKATTKVNVAIFVMGEILANIIGTTGTSMLLLRPMLDVNRNRKHKVHTVIFFIFLVSNIGGCLLPLGDPPLFLGYLKGVNFFWTATHIFPLFCFISVALLSIYVVLDKWFLSRERVVDELDDPHHETDPHHEHHYAHVPSIQISGFLNIWLMVAIAALVACTGLLPKKEAFSVFDTAVHYKSLLRDIGLVVISAISLYSRKRANERHKNDHRVSDHNMEAHVYHNGECACYHNEEGACTCGHDLPETAPSHQEASSPGIMPPGIMSQDIMSFDDESSHISKISWGPLSEVARYFIAIFITMAPIAAMLKGGHEFFEPIRHTLGHTPHSAFWYFWFVSPFSAFLDNAPTYVVFFKMAGGDAVSLMGKYASVLTAISAGAVFMGAMTYIGNAPNFMVASIAKQYGVRMPSFLGYMAWSSAILLPVLLLASYLFLY
ncbi:MAG: sodium:proton antiporter [Holosporales bacterium]|jgi:Na+/H+ antiporter NhaD/arsenite permease-like protein|nr:sodium:proton antiporter [Holosporales bacterium]